jgi:hypothetical protein
VAVESFWRRVDHEPGDDPAFDEVLAALDRPAGPDLLGSEEHHRLEARDFSEAAGPLDSLLQTLSDELGRLKDGSDQPDGLAESETPGMGPVPPLVLDDDPHKPPVLFGEVQPRPLTEQQYSVVRVLLDNHPKRLKTSDLKRKVGAYCSSHRLAGPNDFVKVLKGLAKDPQWAEVLSFPRKGGQHTGYGLNLTPRN